MPAAELFEINPRFNIAPSQPILAVTQVGENRSLGLFDWGLIPSWSKDATGIINARAETLDEKPSFSESFQRRRCLIPADGFYEWQKRGKSRQPYFFQLQDEEPFAFAGLWDQWQNNGRTSSTCAIITTRPNELLAEIHDRMPAILDPDNYDEWLDNRTPASELKGMLLPFPAAAMNGYPVSSEVNSPKVDNETLVQPIQPEPEAQPSLF